MNWKSIQLPLTEDHIAGLHAGDAVYLTGIVITIRDRSLAMIAELVQKKEKLPFEFTNQIIYFTGPTPTPPGKIVGSAGPTTSARMVPYMEMMLQQGVKGFIGKGRLFEQTKLLLGTYRALYFTTYGGAGAYLSKRIVSSEILAYPELGPEAVYRYEIKNFPVFVANDIYFGDIHENAFRNR
ncbi:MAG: fumarate hydratase C-terminal domain-containing protein [Spirochaetes bacterium]|nr:fumarate hydratase C-terminal domain-containing protein [Spirochaetota bacterium]